MRIPAVCLFLLALVRGTAANNPVPIVDPGVLPLRVHVFEDYETDIEKRWWLRGAAESGNVPPALSGAAPNRRCCRATVSKDFDDKMGDASKTWKAVVFNPVPGPPMGASTRLSFRYWLKDADSIRVQIYSLSNGYHRQLALQNLTAGSWQSATVDITAARRPDGSGGPLSADERIDDIQFYIVPSAELLIDDIILFDAAPAGEPFPKRIIFTGWFDTGKQGQEWPGDFEIVSHEPPRTWKAAKSVLNVKTGTPWLRVYLRGLRPLSGLNRLRFRYRLSGAGPLRVVLANSKDGGEWPAELTNPAPGEWSESVLDFPVAADRSAADEIRFLVPKGSELLVDDVLLYQPAKS